MMFHLELRSRTFLLRVMIFVQLFSDNFFNDFLFWKLGCIGAHTTGQARCQLFRGRIYNETIIDSNFATSVKSNCPSTGGDSNLTSLDVTTNVLFDNAYFKNLVNKKGLLHSDQQLFSGGSTDSQVTTYSTSPSTFYTDFASAMVKMGNLSPLTGNNGQIRTNCRKIN